MRAFGGEDSAFGRSARDFIVGGDGARDRVDCGPGNDRVLADRGNRIGDCEVLELATK